ncbi:MAG: mechanosensitive ion channel family protein [Lentisphaeria bacterium]|nr:mechanosensitive ion channel family protein [Lentisphaeria bacterium]
MFWRLVLWISILFCSTALFAEDLPDPSALLQAVQAKENTYSTWFLQQKGAIFAALIKSLLTVMIRVLLLYLRRKYRETVKLADILLQPLLLFITLALCFHFIHPVIQSLPGKSAAAVEMKLFYAGATLIITWAILGLITLLNRQIRRFAERNGNTLDDLTLDLTGNILKGTIIFLAMLFIGQNIFQLNISALLAGAGVIGLAVALASRDTLSNFFGTIVIAGDSPFRIGDLIKTGMVEGIVEHVGARSSRIRSRDESLYTIPNSLLAADAVCLISRKGLIKYSPELGLIYQTSPEQMEQAIRLLHEIADDFHGPDQPEYRPHIYFETFAPYSLNIHLIVWLKAENFAAAEALRDELNRAILQKFNAAGLEFAYPTQTLFPGKDPEKT